ncbi:PAS domain-containing protein [uncultured Sphingomonas sp.]|uniref:PAS domain-containing protein n=1 Tax=uncultured Sphingomonas sp. TaxID=158754 RepID=UPI0035CAC5C2
MTSANSLAVQEDRRLAALARYRVMNTPREDGFDELAALASEICGTPIAVVNLIGGDRQWFKAEVGLGVDSTPLETSFCGTAILEEEFMLVPDATQDERFACNPLVTADPGLKFYAGALLKSPDGYPIGTLCVLDYEPRSLTEQQQRALCRLARQVMAQLELRLVLLEREEANAELRVSDARFRAAVGAVEGVLWTNNFAGEMTGVQSGWAALTGQSSDEYQGYGWSKAVHPDDAQPTIDAWNTAVAKRSTFLFEHRIRRHDGVWRRFSIRAVPTLDAGGEIREWVGVHTDITEQRAAEEQLRNLNQQLEERVASAFAERRLFAELVENTDAFVFVLDSDMRCLAINKAAVDEFERVYGKRPAAGVCLPDLIADHPEEQAAMRAVWARALAGEEFTQVGEFGEATRDRRAYEMKFNVLRDVDGRQIGAYQFVYDVTDRMREQAALATAEDALRQSQKLEAIGQLTGGVAHDFNNLLTVIRGSVDLLRRDDLSDEKRARYVDAIGGTADRAAKLTGQLLAFARRQALSADLFDAGASLGEVATMLQTMTGSRIRLSVQVPAEPYFIVADRSQFDTAIVNMGINARDAMGGEGRLTISTGPVSGIPPIRGHAAVVGDFIAVTVADTGAGIASDQIDRIFEPFFTTKGVGEGTGLGLSQVIGFAKQSGGDIRVDSTIGEGTTFTLYLPRAYPDEATSPPGDAESSHVDGDGTCVLVVEDNQDVGRFATAALAELGYESVLAGDAGAALAALATGTAQFNIVFSDVMMPGMNGIELGEEIRRLYPDMPVILTSGYSHVLAQNGRYGFELLHKPYSVEQLSRVLQKAVAWQSARRS